MTATGDPHQPVGAYVLHALPPAEEAAFDNHLAGCAACRHEVAELSAVTLQLAAAEDAVPSSGLRERVLDQIGRTRQEHTPRHTPRRWRALRVALAACLAVTVGLGGVAVWQYTRADDARAELAREEAGSSALTDILAAPDATVSTRTLADGGRVSVVASRTQGRAAAIATGLPRLGGAKVYELWYAAKAGDLRPAGLLPGSGGQYAQVLDGDLGDAGAVGITVEPATGSKQPTSAPLGIITIPA
ncbi:anti-sigma factor domain-containing protein [Streptomyces sp. NPDC087903]|uniref:anti-sigma factor n=1 Tax=Streptomyces sp. NPDC087903 TaxID=3365819 RepID=UPI00380D92B0